MTRTATVAVVLAALVAVPATTEAAKLLTGKNIKDGSIKLRDLARDAKPRHGQDGQDGFPGPRGPQGPQGVQGPQGAPGPQSVPVHRVESPEVVMGNSGAGSVQSATAICPPGKVVTGGGFAASSYQVAISYAHGFADRYSAIGVNLGERQETLKVSALCVPGTATTARYARGADVATRVRALRRQVRDTN